MVLEQRLNTINRKKKKKNILRIRIRIIITMMISIMMIINVYDNYSIFEEHDWVNIIIIVTWVQLEKKGVLSTWPTC